MEKINELEECIAGDKDLILEKKKTLSKKEFEKWYKEYAKDLKEKLNAEKKEQTEESI